MAAHTRVTDVLLGSIVTLIGLPVGLGPAVGGWIAGRTTDGPHRGAVAGAVAGLLGSLPWAGLVFAAASGAIDPIGYHEGWVHVGVNPAAPATLALWQEVGLAAMVLATMTAMALGGGIVAGVRTDVLATIRADLADAA